MFYIEMLMANMSYGVVICNMRGDILYCQDGYAEDELPHYSKPFMGTAKFISYLPFRKG